MTMERRLSDDRSLWARLLEHDASAWQTLVREMSPLLMAMAGKALAAFPGAAASQDAEDAVARVWEQVLEDDCRLVRRGLAQGYFLQTLMVMTRNRAIDILRSRQLQTVPYTDQVPMPEAIQGESEEWPAGLLHDALETLAPREKNVVRLFFLQGKKYREIADLTGIPQNSIGPTLGRALLKLRERMKRMEGGPSKPE